MRIAISNIAWDVNEDMSIAELLNNHEVDAIDLAPGKYFPDPIKATDLEIGEVKRFWIEHGIEITGMQALMFGTAGLNIFGKNDVQEATLTHLAAICKIGAGLGATRLVFGSPKNRDSSGLDSEQVLDQAVSFFRRLGNIANAHGVIFCLEPNPPCYGANFMTNCDETAIIVRAIDHSAIKMQFDTGSLLICGENAERVLEDSANLIGHIHASEPGLAPLGDLGSDHRKIHDALVKFLPDHVVSVEMLATKTEPHLKSVSRALSCALQYYRPTVGTI